MRARSFYGFTTYNKTPLMLSMLGGIVGDSAVWKAQSDFGKAWMFKHPVAVGLHVLHEPRAQQGPGLVLVLLAVHDGDGSTDRSRA